MHIVYCKSKHGPGWQVRSGKRGPGQSRFFADGKHGGKDGSRHAAMAFALAALPHQPPKPRGRITKRNNTGVDGIQLAYVQSSSGVAMRYAKVHVRLPDGRETNRSVSLEKHGMAEGLLLALEKRGYKETAELHALLPVLLKAARRVF